MKKKVNTGLTLNTLYTNMSIPIHFQQQISRMTDHQLQKALDMHKYMQFIIEREQTRRVHNGQSDADVPPPQNENASLELEIRQPDNPISEKHAI